MMFHVPGSHIPFPMFWEHGFYGVIQGSVALIHPKDPGVGYFFLEEHLNGVDLRASSVVECEVYTGRACQGPRGHPLRSRLGAAARSLLFPW